MVIILIIFGLVIQIRLFLNIYPKRDETSFYDPL